MIVPFLYLCVTDDDYPEVNPSVTGFARSKTLRVASKNVVLRVVVALNLRIILKLYMWLISL